MFDVSYYYYKKRIGVMTLIIKTIRPAIVSVLLSSLVLGYNPPREPVVIQDGIMQWDYDGEDWSYLAPDGKLVVGRFCDSMGDVYYAGADGKLLCEGYFGQEYFGADGRLVNPSAKGADKFKKVVGEFEAGEAVYFKNTDEVVDFMHWYSSQWSMGKHDTNLQAWVSSLTGRVKFTKPREFLYDREAVMRELFDRFGRLDPSLSDLEKINMACSKLSGFTYDETMYLESIHDVLATSSGVCWQFSRLVQCLLKDTQRIHAAYINAISEHRDREFEVLVNAGYSLKVESKLADRLWLCSLVENDTFYFREKSTPSGDFISMLGYSIDSDPILRGSVYVTEDYEGVFIGNSFSDDRLQVRVNESGWVCGELSGSFDDLDRSVAKVIGYLRGMVSEFRKKVGSDKLYYHCSSFMYNITSKFASEGFQIIKQKFISRDDISQKKSMRGTLQISGDRDDHITLQFLIKDDLSVSVSARDKENQIRQTFSAIDNEVYQNVYDEVVHKCKLNQFGRLEKALKLVSGYCREPLTVLDRGKYSMGDKYRVIAVMDGEMVQLYIRGGIKSSHSYYFWDNLRDIAVGVSDALCGNEKK